MRFALIFVALAACKQSAPAPEIADVMMIDAASIAHLTVDVRADGTLALDGRTIKDEAELTERTREIARDKPVLSAVIHVDKDVAYERVIAAERALKQGGVVHMSFGGFGAALDAAL